VQSDEQRTDSQTGAVVALLRAVLGDGLAGVHRHGSATLGGLGPRSDLDLLAVAHESLSGAQREDLLSGLLDVSGRRARVFPGRPVELVVVVGLDLHPWRHPPTCDFLYGEWLRDDYLAGRVPRREVMPDLAILLRMARDADDTVTGAAAAVSLPRVPWDDVVRAGRHGVPGLLADLRGDEANVLLTLARVWHTGVTRSLVRKDVAADWALARLPEEGRAAMARARGVYLGEEPDVWDGWDAAVAACVAEVTRALGAQDAPEP
jgi:streptomycin 3"-adenylyltransferase